MGCCVGLFLSRADVEEEDITEAVSALTDCDVDMMLACFLEEELEPMLKILERPDIMDVVLFVCLVDWLGIVKVVWSRELVGEIERILGCNSRLMEDLRVCSMLVVED